MISRKLCKFIAGTACFLFVAGGVHAQTFYFKSGGQPWEINDPFAAKDVKPDPNKAIVSGQTITKKSRDYEVSRKFSDVSKIEWGKTPPAIEEADLEVLRGNADKALMLIEPVVRFFTPLKKTPGNLWLRAANIKLDALVLLKNDTVIEDFIGELEEMNDGTIPGLDEKIKLAKIDRLVRKGRSEEALTQADALLKDTSNLDLIARLHIVKADALFQLRQYENAMNMYLRIPVFYGSQTKYVPPALLGAAKSFRGMDTPQNKHLKLEEVANGYLSDLVTQYPLSKEAEEALAMLPKDVREALAKAGGNVGLGEVPAGDSAETPATEPAKEEKTDADDE